RAWRREWGQWDRSWRGESFRRSEKYGRQGDTVRWRRSRERAGSHSRNCGLFYDREERLRRRSARRDLRGTVAWRDERRRVNLLPRSQRQGEERRGRRLLKTCAR